MSEKPMPNRRQERSVREGMITRVLGLLLRERPESICLFAEPGMGMRRLVDSVIGDLGEHKEYQTLLISLAQLDLSTPQAFEQRLYQAISSLVPSSRSATSDVPGSMNGLLEALAPKRLIVFITEFDLVAERLTSTGLDQLRALSAIDNAALVLASHSPLSDLLSKQSIERVSPLKVVSIQLPLLTIEEAQQLIEQEVKAYVGRMGQGPTRLVEHNCWPRIESLLMEEAGRYPLLLKQALDVLFVETFPRKWRESATNDEFQDFLNELRLDIRASADVREFCRLLIKRCERNSGAFALVVQLAQHDLSSSDHVPATHLDPVQIRTLRGLVDDRGQGGSRSPGLFSRAFAYWVVQTHQDQNSQGADSALLTTLEYNMDRREVIFGDQLSKLTATENRLLSYLVERAGEVVAKEDLERDVWKGKAKPSSSVVAKGIYRLRQQIEPDPDNPQYIIAYRGKGYSLKLNILKGSR